jgi:hypothetical protein
MLDAKSLGERGVSQADKRALQNMPDTRFGDVCVIACTTKGCETTGGIFRLDNTEMSQPYWVQRLRYYGWLITGTDSYCPFCAPKLQQGA